MIGREVSHYKILDRLGGGGMGVVYKAEDTHLGRVVALKFLNTELLANDSIRKRFLHEARAASSIDHPNVCPVYEVGESEDGRTFMAMSYCEGRSLRDVIQDGPTAPREAFSIAFGIAQGLWAAHRRGIVHRDIKPGNVILTDDGFVRIVDFGLALLIGDSRVTSGGVTVGTVAYMSPEQTSDSTVSANTDIWSLGVTLYELLTGHLPFRGNVNAALVYSIVHEPHTPLPDSVPPQCARIVDRCLEKDPAKRYQTVEELLEEMLKAAQELGWESSVASATIAQIIDSKRRRDRWRRTGMVAGALLVTAGGIAGYRALHTHSPYVTKTRLAMMPLDNMLGPNHDAFVAGLGDHISRAFDAASRERKSMWSVPYATVVRSQLANPADAGPSFGVNRVVTGSVQRYEDHAIVNLECRNAANLRVVSHQAIEFDANAPGKLLDDVEAAARRMTGVHDEPKTQFHARDATAARLYLAGLGHLTPTPGPQVVADSTQVRLAVAALDSCVHDDPDFVPGLCALGSAALRRFSQTTNQRMIDLARDCSARATHLAPRFPDAMLLRAEVWRKSDQADSAITAYGELLAVSPANYSGVYWRVHLLAEQSRYTEAESTYLAMTTAAPDYWLGFTSLGAFYFNRDRIDDALAAWHRSVELAPRDATTLNNLGAIHFKRNEWAAARAMFQQAFHIRPDCESCNNVATALYFDRKYDESAHYFEYAIQYCDTNDCRTFGNLASALYWTDGGRNRADAVYRRAIGKALAGLGRKPGDPELTSFLIDYYVMSDDTAGAQTTIAHASNKALENPRVLYSIGSAYEKMGRRELALRYLASAVHRGFTLSVVEQAPVLADLVKDPMFDEVVRKAAADAGATAATDKH